MTTGKQKAARVPVDYIRRAGRWKWPLTVAFLAVTAVALAALAVSGRWKAAASPGPLNRVHAAWENDCATCHKPLSPAGGDNALARTVGGKRPDDSLCQSCHSGAPHHPGREIAEQVGSCGSCHHEHRGRDASLTDLRDSACTACHAKLADHVVGGTTNVAGSIHRFDLDHPEFSLIKAERERLASGGPAVDPGKLKFNHQVHMALGLKHAPGDAKSWTLGDIPADQRERYARQQPENRRDGSDAVQLSCASCHETEGGATPTAGAYLPPVSYERHCQACHPLTIGGALPGVKLPHPLKAADVQRALWGAFVERAAHDQKKSNAAPAAPLPGHSLDPAEEKARAEVEARVREADQFLRREDADNLARQVFEGKNACGLCHQYRPAEGGKGLPEVLPVQVPEVWFKHAGFDHRSHRAVDCVQCHDKAVTSTTNADLLLPGVENCKQCHAERAMKGNQLVGGVRQECTTCHGYHADNGTAKGLADPARGSRRRGTIEELLSGRLGAP
ncbi:MAG TPA: hypothetical protein VFW33_20205 [Gemmataceae bacterium]|nr:hypothetical protein [Gemmataceae bacterium]